MRQSIAALALVVTASAPAFGQTLCNPLAPLPATVLRDAHGVPHIFASNLDDLFFTNGYVEAQDRLFEMEILRRAGKGTLSEVLGAAYLDMDIAARRDLYTPAEWQAQLDALSPADRQSLTQFAAGATRYICEARLDPSSKMPAEYAALAFLPDDWTVLDSVAAADYLIGVFGSFGGDEVHNAAFFFDVASRIGRGKARRVFDDHFPLFDDQSPTTIPQLEKTFDDPLRHSTRRFATRQLRVLQQYLRSIDRAAGLAAAQAHTAAAARAALGLGDGTVHHASNAILVSGALTDTGNPILLGGPQVGYAIPSFFFEVGLHTPTTGVVGVIPPAGPGVVIGRTQNFAFTITSGISDQVDTYLEVLNPGNDHQYLYNGAYLDMDCRTETFTVREPPPPAGSGGAPMTETRELCRTRHGPVFFTDPAGGAAFSHASSHRNLELASAAAWLRIGQATSGDVRELWGTEHRVQALQDGILRELAADGKLSVDDVNLVMFQAAKKDEYAGGRGAFDGRPAVVSPFAALSAAVDALPSTDSQKADLSAGRDLIRQWIEADTTLPMTALKTHATVMRTVHGAPLIDTDGDGFYQHPGAALYERWRETLQHRVFDDELGSFVDALHYDPAPGANTGDHGGGDTQDSVLVHALAGRGPTGRRTIKYFDDVRTPLRETADFQLVQSLRQAMADLGDCLAPSPVTCRHANHVNVFTSLGAAPNQTIGQTRGGVDRGSYNQIVELAPTLFSVNVVPPGQSGFINAALLAQIEAAQSDAQRRQIMDAAHLTDQLDLYERFEYKPMPFTQPEVMAAQ